MPAPNQGRSAIKLHGLKLQKCPHPMAKKTPRPKTTKLPLNSPPPLPGSPANQKEKVHGKSEERYINIGPRIHICAGESSLFRADVSGSSDKHCKSREQRFV